MSVINKMLRDLDQRQAPGPLGGAVVQPPLPEAPHSGNHGRFTPAPAATPPSRAAMAGWLGLGTVVLAGLGLAGGLAWQRLGGGVPAAAAPLAHPVAAVAPTLAMAPASAPASASAAVVPTVSPARVEPAPPLAAVSAPRAAMALEPAASATKPTPTAQNAAPSVSVTAATPTPPGRAEEKAAPGLKLAAALRIEPSLATRSVPPAEPARTAALPASASTVAPASPPTSLVPAETLSAVQRQQQASADALLQAQTLWSAGSQAAAVDLLQQSVDAAERSAKAGTSAAGNPALLSLVRELVRMQMAQSHFSAVWELLVRLETVLGNPPDLWGLRGNTGQRLGRHQDSVNAYRTALQFRPDEQRWLLGCAVSLAALGQSAQATEMAERARSVGPISRDVQVYLQQMGVFLKDK